MYLNEDCENHRPLGQGMVITGSNIWQCPLSGTKLEQTPEGFFAPEVGVTYPILAGVPLLKIEHTSSGISV